MDFDDNSDCDDNDEFTYPELQRKNPLRPVSGIETTTDGGDGAGDLGNIEAGLDCDDPAATLNLDDTDGDGFTTCDEDCNDNDATLTPTRGYGWFQYL